MARGGIWKFRNVLTYDFLHENWIVLNKSAAAIGLEIGASERPVFDALKRHGITATMKSPQDLSIFFGSGAKTRFKSGQVAPMKGRKGRSPAWKGKTKETDPVVARIAANNRGIARPNAKGPLHHNWKNGATDEAQLVRNGAPYAAWRLAVYTRDDFTCQKCGAKGVCLHAHHIKQFATHPHLRLDMANGLTVCIPCHHAIPHTNWSPKKRL